MNACATCCDQTPVHPLVPTPGIPQSWTYPRRRRTGMGDWPDDGPARQWQDCRCCQHRGVIVGESIFATLHTNVGPIRLELFPNHAPKTVANFVGPGRGDASEYIDPRTGAPGQGPYYDGVIFHRVIPNFMIQGGDPTGTGTRRPGLHVQRRVAPGADLRPAVPAGHGQRRQDAGRQRHQRVAVLRHRVADPAPQLQAHDLRRGRRRGVPRRSSTRSRPPGPTRTGRCRTS